MSSSIPVKSILKQKAVPREHAAAGNEQSQQRKDQRNYEIALQHAVRIQTQKDAEAHILKSLMSLMELPASNDFTPGEAKVFLQHIIPFQPSDFDSLVEERRIDGRCGYVLCSNPPRSNKLSSKIDPGAANWCGEICARRGFYIRAQLNTVPVWERSPNYIPDVQLHPDDQAKIRRMEDRAAPNKTIDEATVARRADRAARVEQWRENVAGDPAAEQRLKMLAAERGETHTSFRPGQVLSDDVVERPRRHDQAAKPPEFDDDVEAAFDAIEGYQPTREWKQDLSEAEIDVDVDERDDG